MEIRKDMCLNHDPYHFSLRAAALIIQNNHLLVAKHKDYDCYYTIGGGVHMNEPTEDAVLREILEETGVHAVIDRLVYVLERFYCTDSEHQHELTFFYLISTMDTPIENGSHTDQLSERMHWLPIQDLHKYPLVPEFLREELTHISPTIQHIISR